MARDRRIVSDIRSRAARPHLHGEGIEIGAMDFPLIVPDGVVVRHLDNKTREANIRRAPRAVQERIPRVDYLEDGFALPSIDSASQDFVIANHVLEHAPDPLTALLHWARVLRVNGTLFITVPIAAQCFDRLRPLSSLEHILQDYKLVVAGLTEEKKSRDRQHYIEWTTLSEPTAAALPDGPRLLNRSDQESRADRLWYESADIHFHTFSLESLTELLHYFVAVIDPTMSIISVKPQKSEVVAIMKRQCSKIDLAQTD